MKTLFRLLIAGILLLGTSCEKEPFLDFGIYLDSLIDKIEHETEALTFSDDDRDDMLKLLEYTKKLQQKQQKNDKNNPKDS